MGLDNPLHIGLVLLVVLLIFGARRLPEIGRSLGSGIREFKQSVTGESDRAALGVGEQAKGPIMGTPPTPAQTAESPAAAPPAGQPVAAQPVTASQAEQTDSRVA
jgi:sec-independent protein translocase protein TatA